MKHVTYEGFGNRLRALVGLALGVIAAGCGGSGPADTVRGAAVAARTEDALAFETYVAVDVMPPADRALLAHVLPHGQLGGVRILEENASVEWGVRDPGLDTTIVLDLRLRRDPDRWRVVRLGNFGEFSRALLDARARRLDAENAAVQGRMRRVLQVGAVEARVAKRTDNDPYAPQTYADLSFDLKVFNAGKHEIESAVIHALPDIRQGPAYPVRVLLARPLAPGTAGTVSLDTTINVSGGEGDTDWNQVEAWRRRAGTGRPVELVVAAGSRRDTLREYADWHEFVRRRKP